MSRMSDLDIDNQERVGNPTRHWHVVPIDKDLGEWIHRDLDSAWITIKKLVARGAHRVEIDPCDREECLALERAMEMNGV